MSTLHDIKSASKYLKISPQQVRNLCRSSKIKSVKMGGSWLIYEEELNRFYDNSSCGVAENQPSYTSRKELLKKRPIALSFFSGAMGMDIGLEKAGINIILASEIDNACRKTILKNRPEIALIGDIRDYSPQEIKGISGLEQDDEIELIVGGPPCQAFSTAGKRKGFEDERGNVFLNFIEIIDTLRPKYAVIENVRGLLSAPLRHRPHNERGLGFPDLTPEELPGGALYHILVKLKKSGYSYSFELYNSANFGTPQKRERVVIICSRDKESVPFLEPKYHENGNYGLPKWKNLKEAFSLLNNIKHTYINFPEKRLKFYRLLSAGENWRNLPEGMQKAAMGQSFYSDGGKTGFLRILDWNSPSPTLVTHPAMPATDLAHPEEDRPLSVEEYKAIQEFPNDWIIEGSVLEQYKQIGNAVPISLGFAIGTLIQKMLKNENIIQIPGFRYSRYKNTNHIDWEKEYLKEVERKKQLILV